MKCPNDGETLLMTDRSGVEIDYCPRCRGVWLDRGELDKIIERAALPAGSDSAPQATHATTHATPGATTRSVSSERKSDRDGRGRDDDDRNEDRERRDGKERYRKSWKRDSFLKELFDFD